MSRYRPFSGLPDRIKTSLAPQVKRRFLISSGGLQASPKELKSH